MDLEKRNLEAWKSLDPLIRNGINWSGVEPEEAELAVENLLIVFQGNPKRLAVALSCVAFNYGTAIDEITEVEMQRDLFRGQCIRVSLIAIIMIVWILFRL